MRLNPFSTMSLSGRFVAMGLVTLVMVSILFASSYTGFRHNIIHVRLINGLNTVNEDIQAATLSANAFIAAGNEAFLKNALSSLTQAGASAGTLLEYSPSDPAHIHALARLLDEYRISLGRNNFV